MNFLGFHALSAIWMLALLAPLVLFYFLKLKRPRQVIPSLVLWRQVLNDQRVNSPFQKFKRNLLLILQLLMLLAVVFAALQPYWRGKVARVRRMPVLIDCSASMAALNRAGGVSRLEAARERVRTYIDRLGPEQELCLISFARTAHKRTGFTNNRRILREALDAIQVEDVPSDIEDALRMTQALARSDPFDEVVLLSDGNFPGQANFELSFTLNFQKLGEAGPNMGITALNAKRVENGMWDVFVGVEGSAGAEGAATVEFFQDEELVKSETISLTKGKAERLLFRVPGEKPSTVRARLAPDGFDSLAADNVAYLDLPAVRSLWVYCPASLATYRRALRAMPDVRVLPEEGNAGFESGYDLVITDRPEDLAQRAKVYLTVGVIPGDAQKLLRVDSEGTQVIDWRRNAPLLQHVELADLLILDPMQSNPGVRDGDFENLGFEILVHGKRGPLLLERRAEGKTAFHLLFHTDRSTMPYRVGFPILVSNLVRLAMQTAGLAEAQANRTGVLALETGQPEKRFTVQDPGGATREERSDKTGLLGGIPAPRVGLYTVHPALAGQRRVGASLLCATETALASVDRIQFNEDLHVTASSAAVRTDRSLWTWFALAGFLLLLGEWWYFQRRLAGVGK